MKTPVVQVASGEDRALTCVACGRPDVDFTIGPVRRGGVSWWVGLHRDCLRDPPILAVWQRVDQLKQKLRAAEMQSDLYSDRLDVERRYHEETKGYRQHAEQQLAKVQRELTVLREHLQRVEHECGCVEEHGDFVAWCATDGCKGEHRCCDGEYPECVCWCHE